jgi:hypothetical protein
MRPATAGDAPSRAASRSTEPPSSPSTITLIRDLLRRCCLRRHVRQRGHDRRGRRRASTLILHATRPTSRAPVPLPISVIRSPLRRRPVSGIWRRAAARTAPAAGTPRFRRRFPGRTADTPRTATHIPRTSVAATGPALRARRLTVGLDISPRSRVPPTPTGTSVRPTRPVDARLDCVPVGMMRFQSDRQLSRSPRFQATADNGTRRRAACRAAHARPPARSRSAAPIRALRTARDAVVVLPGCVCGTSTAATQRAGAPRCAWAKVVRPSRARRAGGGSRAGVSTRCSCP